MILAVHDDESDVDVIVCGWTARPDYKGKLELHHSDGSFSFENLTFAEFSRIVVDFKSDPFVDLRKYR